MLISDIVQGEKYYSLLAEFASGFVYNLSTQEAISRIYDQNKYVYYEKAIASPAYNNYVINMSDVQQALYTRRALGVLICAEEDEKLEKTLIDIAKRSYPSLYKLAKRANDKHLENIGDIIYNSGKTSFWANTNILCYLMIKIYSPNKIPINLLSILMGHLENLSNMGFSKYAHIKTHNDKLYQIKETLKLQIGQLRGLEDAEISEYEDIRKAIGVIEWLFEFEEINSLKLLSDFKLNEKQIDETIVSYLMCNSSHNFKDIRPTLVYSIIIKSLLIRYKESKEFFFKNNQESQFMAMKKLEQQIILLKEKNKGLDKEVADYKELYLNLKKDFNKLQEQNIAKVRKEYSSDLAQAQAQVKALENELEKEQAYRPELNHLRSLFFSMEHEELPLSANKSLTDYGDNKKIFIIGGTSDWRLRVTQSHGNVHCLDGFNENIDLNLISNADFVFFFFKYMNHGTYYRVIDYVRVNEIPFGYISRTNMDLAEAEMIAWMDNNRL